MVKEMERKQGVLWRWLARPNGNSEEIFVKREKCESVDNERIQKTNGVRRTNYKHEPISI